MNLIFLFLTAGMIVLNLAGLGLVLHRYVPAYGLAKPVAVVGACLLLFFVEHFVGLGRLNWFWPIASVAALTLCWIERDALRAHWRSELVFVLGFAYAFAWRYINPNIDPQSEHVTDLYFIVNYLDGQRLPPLDHWLPPYRFDFYYAFQHYAAALLGRVFGLDGGTTYNFAFCVMVGLIISTAWLAIGFFCQGRAARVLVLFAFVMGGTGVSPMLYSLIENPKPTAQEQAARDASATSTWQKLGNIIGAPMGPKLTLWSSVRFIGSSDADINTDLGKRLFPPFDPAQKPTGFVPMELPLETFSYLIFLGDFHPPLGSFLLLVIALACIGALERQPGDRFAQGTLALSVPVVLVTNSWIFPLQAALVAAWAGYRVWTKRTPDWRVLFGAGALGFALIYPFLTGFASNPLTLGFGIVQDFEHTPWRHFLALHWPMLALLALIWVNVPGRKLVLTLVLVWGLLFALSEFIYVDDVYGGQYQRFNTVLKWWAWTYAGAIITLGAINIGGRSRIARYGTILVIVLIGAYALDLTRFMLFSPKPHAGRFQGQEWFAYDPTNRAMLLYLKAAEPGIVLERNERGSYTRTSSFALFSGRPALLGWADHEWNWRGQAQYVRVLGDQVTDFYRGSKFDAIDWLQQHNVRYIVWSAEDNAGTPGTFHLIQSQIAAAYTWREFYRADEYRVGIWVRRPRNP